MHSIATVFRAASRQGQWRCGTATLFARRANSTGAASSPEYPPQTAANVFRNAAETAPDPIRSAGIADPNSTVRPVFLENPLIKGDTILQGFRPGKFLKPSEYTQKERSKGRPRRKRPLLGPSAAESRKGDTLYQLGIDPLHECQNSSLMSEFLTDMGKIKSRAQTNLTWKNQRRLGKAIRRARMMGIIPVLSRRPLSYGY
ncbi:hypothetical protein B0H21DRAFT_705426 [Amylocystis lapponica]|nr:hypothetical protein B0H21DRAFT_705426 [Amylocystis lapponica]